jgi:hypothetical protein
MKNTLFLAVIVLAVLPAAAQKMASPNCSANGDPAFEWAQDYAARVDGLLREVHASLQDISAQMAAGRLTPQQARELKLAATRDMISRLDTLAAVYDARLESQEKVETKTGLAAVDAPYISKGTHPNTSGTVSVDELKREAAAAALMSPR